MNTQTAEPSVRERIEAALDALPENADSPWMNLDKMPYIHRTDDPKASPWSCAVVGRFDYLQTMQYMLACQPSSIRALLAEHDATIQSQGAEIDRLKAELQEAALKRVSLFGELQNALEENERLRVALKPFACFACSPAGECDCNNCIARDLLTLTTTKEQS